MRIRKYRCQSPFCILVNQSWFWGAILWILPRVGSAMTRVPGITHITALTTGRAEPDPRARQNTAGREASDRSRHKTQSGFADLFSTRPGPRSHWMPCQQKKTARLRDGRWAGPVWAGRHQTSNYIFSEPNICMKLWSRIVDTQDYLLCSVMTTFPHKRKNFKVSSF